MADRGQKPVFRQFAFVPLEWFCPMRRLSNFLPNFSPPDMDPKQCLMDPFHPLTLLCVIVVMFATVAVHLLTGLGGL